ncbi:MAG: zinc ribbon domain-containing protein [Planctomycetaceae bacterium]|nr:zinc ribbon domain-containing protein [Planctomycetaceae bacterium]MCB9951056.1 zinc ribbon domain-containing protein [Planctomycetaceae bacterium]
MPIFEFHCENCHNEFEELVRPSDKPVCPRCESKKLTKLMSAPAGHVSSGLPIAGPGCPPMGAPPCNPHCCRLPQ